jgi:hypothetical protein
MLPARPLLVFLVLVSMLAPGRAASAAQAAHVPLPPQPQDVPFPEDGWPEGKLAPPAQAALEAALDGAFAEPDPAHPRGTRAVVVVVQGRVVGERYASGFGPGTRLLGWSMTKSVTNALVGVLVGEGRLRVDAPPDVPAWRGGGDPRREITVDQLLRMSSGLDWTERYSVGIRPSDVIEMLYGRGHLDMAGYASGRGLEVPPGSVWKYSSGTSVLLSAILRSTLNDDAAYRAFPRRGLFDRIGMRSAVLEADAAGTFVGSSYGWATARDWARFGLLYLRDGVWNGDRVLPPGWVDYTRTPAPAAPRGEYGAHFWLNAGSSDGSAPPPLPRAPRDLLYASGHDGQCVSIVPSRDLVVVRLGITPGFWSGPYEEFIANVVAAVDAGRPD